MDDRATPLSSGDAPHYLLRDRSLRSKRLHFASMEHLLEHWTYMLFQGVEMLTLCEADRDAAMTARGRVEVAEDGEALRLIAATNGLSEAAADALVRWSVEAGRAAYRSSTLKKPGYSAIAILSPHQGQCISSAPQRRGISRGPVVHSFAAKATGRIEVLNNRFVSPITRGLCHRLHVQSVTDYLWTTAGFTRLALRHRLHVIGLWSAKAALAAAPIAHG